MLQYVVVKSLFFTKSYPSLGIWGRSCGTGVTSWRIFFSHKKIKKQSEQAEEQHLDDSSVSYSTNFMICSQVLVFADIAGVT
jgi:hypothetical protein